MNTTAASVDVVLKAFTAVEQRDAEGLAALCDPEVEFHWPPALVQAGTRVLRNAPSGLRGRFEELWDPFQPTEDVRRMSPRVVAASEDEVVVLWRQRGIDPEGVRLDSPVLGLYEVRDGLLARAQMFYFDPGAVRAFLER